MQYIPGSSVTLSASLKYLAKNLPLPDDSDLQTRIPQICVDYLSHEWLEEDVWKSWRNMTRHKNEVANGVRLENASWRTWWKQRNKLKTVSPETLNWLKDSDVTWLYGPLHTAAEPVPKPKQSTYVDRYNLEKASGRKPILKHRTISELLNIHPDHGAAVAQPSAGSPALEAVSMDFAAGDVDRIDSPRPTIPHTRSDSIINGRIAHIQSPAPSGDGARHDRVAATSPPPHSASPATISDDPLSADCGSYLSLSPSGVKKHISFNTFVEQCISIEDPSIPRRESPGQNEASSSDERDDDILSSTSSVLEMRPTGSRANERGPILRSNSLSQEREHITIAPIRPTLLKASEQLPAPSPAVVYVPPQGFDWDLSPENESSSSSDSSSGDNLSSVSGSVGGVDLGFVVPQWGRLPIAPGAVGTGVTGSAGPTGIGEDVYDAAGYQEQQRRYHQALQDETQRSSTVIGMHAGRSKWVPGDAIPDEDVEEESDTGSEDDAVESSDVSSDEGDDLAAKGEGRSSAKGSRETSNISSNTATSIISRSTGSSSTTSAPRTIIGDEAASPPATARPSSTRSSSQPGKGILKNAAAGGAQATVGGNAADSSVPLAVPIGTLKPSGSHTSVVSPPSHGGGSSYFHMPPTAIMSSPPTNASLNVGSAGFLSPSRSDAIFAAVPPSNGRGRTATRSASSSGISDRSRSSSKISGASSPIGSVSPSGCGSPSGSRASSVLGNKRSSTDVGVVGRSVAVGVGASGRNGLAIARQNSISPPTVSSPLAGVSLGSLPTSNLGTIVANVPLQTGLPNSSAPSATPRGGPPLSRSGMQWSRSSKPGRSTSGSSNTSSDSSASVGTANGTAHRPVPSPTAAQIAAAAPAAGATSLPIHVKKPSGGPLLPNGEPRPTVIISPKIPLGVGFAHDPESGASSAVSSPSGGQGVDVREARLEEEMSKARTIHKIVGRSSQDPLGQADAKPFFERTTTAPTSSNSPMSGAAEPLSPGRSTVTVAPSDPSKVVLRATPPSPKSKSSPSSAVVTQSSVSASTINPPGDGTMAGKAADSIVSSARGLLGAIWGSSDGHATK